MRADVISNGVSAIQAGVAGVLGDQLGIAYDAGSVDQKGLDGSFTQADIDSAVAASKALDAQALSDSQAADAKAFSDAKMASDALMADLQDKFDALSKKESSESGIIAGFQSSKAALQAVLDGLLALNPVQPSA